MRSFAAAGVLALLSLMAMLAGCASGPAPDPVVEAARYTVPPVVAYPAASRRWKEEGRVVMRVQVKADGSVGFVDVQTSSGASRLDAAAVQAVRQARFESARTRSGKRVDSVVLVPIQFKLE